MTRTVKRVQGLDDYAAAALRIRYGTMKNFCDERGIRPQALSNFLAGRMDSVGRQTAAGIRKALQEEGLLKARDYKAERRRRALKMFYSFHHLKINSQ